MIMLAFAVPRIGIGLSTVTVVVSQILASMVIDHFGWFNSTQVVFNSPRIIGAILLIAGMSVSTEEHKPRFCMFRTLSYGKINKTIKVNQLKLG